MSEKVKVEPVKEELDKIDAYAIYEEILSANKCAICKNRKEICFSQEAAEFSLKLICANYEAYDSGYTRTFIEHGRCYEKDGVEVSLYWTKIKLIVEE